MAELSPDARLALAYSGRGLREPFAALLQLDAILGHSLTAAREPVLAQIRLAWWREQLERLPVDGAGPDPVLISIDRVMRNHDVNRAQLVDLVNGWETLLQESPPGRTGIANHAKGRGSALFGLAAGIVGAPTDDVMQKAGMIWALVDFARKPGDASGRNFALAEAARIGSVARQMSVKLRPFAVLARFAERDAAAGLDRLPREGTPRRIAQAWGLIARLS